MVFEKTGTNYRSYEMGSDACWHATCHISRVVLSVELATWSIITFLGSSDSLCKVHSMQTVWKCQINNLSRQQIYDIRDETRQTVIASIIISEKLKARALLADDIPLYAALPQTGHIPHEMTVFFCISLQSHKAHGTVAKQDDSSW